MTEGNQDPGRAAYIARAVDRMLERIPPRYWRAEATDPKVLAWCDEVIAAYSVRAPMPPPLLLLGPTGGGKTWQAYGAVKRITIDALAADPAVLIKWEATNVPDLLARLRPSGSPDPEGEFERFAQVPLLFLDDIAAQKDTAWTGEVMYRLLDRRSAWMRPGVYVSNLPFAHDELPSIESVFDARIVSRLAECRRVAIKGDDRPEPAGGRAVMPPALRAALRDDRRLSGWAKFVWIQIDAGPNPDNPADPERPLFADVARWCSPLSPRLVLRAVRELDEGGWLRGRLTPDGWLYELAAPEPGR